MPYVFMMGQTTPEWWEVRRGIPTASDFDKIITAVKGDRSTSSTGYIAQLIADLVNPAPNYFMDHGPARGTQAMENGKETEPAARTWLAQRTDLDIKEVGFIVNNSFSLGCSPDGVIGLDFNPEAAGEWRGQPYFEITALEATVELKCPKRATHVQYLLDGLILPKDYKPQVHGHLVAAEALACHFVSYADGLPPFRLKVERDGYTDKVEKATNDFVAEYLKALEKVGLKPPTMPRGTT